MKESLAARTILARSLVALGLVMAGGRASNAFAAAVEPEATARTLPSGWRLAPDTPVTRQSPRLLNYYHIGGLEGHVRNKAERLAQWDVLILNPDDVRRERLSLAAMRRLNPRIRVLAWIPVQGPNESLSPGVPRRGPNDWFAKTATGEYLAPHWGGHLMNVRTADFAWPRHLLRFVTDHCLGSGGYDGVLFDCLWETEPAGCDVNADGVQDRRDTAAWQEGLLFLLRQLRQRFPKAIVTGNGGGPWSETCPYYPYVNGCMHENALGDQFGGTEWRTLWDGYCRAVAKAGVQPVLHLVAVDVRAEGRTQSVAARLERLTDQDRRRLRLGLATTLLRDAGYFAFDRGDCLHGQLWWFDEYETDLGQPVAPFQPDRFGPGTFARAFQHGWVVVNPTDQAIDVPTPAPLTDATSRAVGQRFRIPPRDARILRCY